MSGFISITELREIVAQRRIVLRESLKCQKMKEGMYESGEDTVTLGNLE